MEKTTRKKRWKTKLVQFKNIGQAEKKNATPKGKGWRDVRNTSGKKKKLNSMGDIHDRRYCKDEGFGGGTPKRKAG